MKRAALILCIALGIVLRMFSISWNTIAHGDIALDAAGAEAFAYQGNFTLSDDDSLRPADRYLVQHPPIWALLGAGVMTLTGADAFPALKLLSLTFGILVLLMMYRLSIFLFTKDIALVLTTILSTSWLMIDFSGNGALYSLHTLLFLLWIDCALRNYKWNAVVLGAISAVAYLTNYQTLILIPAALILFSLEPKTLLKNATLYITTFALLICPWLIRNELLFGHLFFGHTVNSTYVYAKIGVQSLDYVYTIDDKLTVLTQIFTRWLPFNLYFAARKLFILAPLLFIAFAYAWAEYPFAIKRVRSLFPILIVFLGHLALSAAWPVMKFRYMVPMLPLVLLLATEQVWHWNISDTTKNRFLAASLCCTLVLSYLTYRQIPTHTYYYDGAITQDAFHSEGEIDYMKQQGAL